jgi:hypothetical protein
MADFSLLRCLAAVLIANSHLEDFYPIRQLAADGLLGDSLFFFLSGFGLACGERKPRRGFFHWYMRRAGRIYPAVFLVVLMLEYLPNQGWRTWTAADYGWNFLWVRSYGFVHQIMIFYALFYVIIRSGGMPLVRALWVLLFAAHAAFALVGLDRSAYHVFHWVFYFQLMLFGGWLGYREIGARSGWAVWAVLAGLCAAYFGMRAWLAIGHADPRLGILVYMLVFPLTYAMAVANQSLTGACDVLRRPVVALPVGLLAGATLEMYLVHNHFLTSAAIRSVRFPGNVAVFLGASAALAIAFAWAAAHLRAALGQPGRGHAAPARRPISAAPQPTR